MKRSVMACSKVAACLLAGATAALSATAAFAQGVNIEEIFWCEESEPTGNQSPEECIASRTALLTNCTSCHTFVPIVTTQKTPEQWRATMEAHRDRVPMTVMGDEEYAQLEEFLVLHFNPENEPPTLPPELESLGTNQAF